MAEEKTIQQLKEELERVRAELADVKPKYSLYRDLVQLAVDAIVSGDQQGNIIGVNASAEQLSGYTRQELLGANIGIFFSEVEKKRVPFRYDLLLQGQTLCSERLLTCKDGTLVPIEMNSKMMPDGSFHTFIRDIGARKEMEEMLRDSEIKRRALDEASFEAIFLSSDGICIGQNAAAEKMFGYSELEAIGRPGSDWVVSEEWEKVNQKRLSTEMELYETVVVRKDGSTFPVEAQGKTIRYEGREVRVTALRDISERKKAERDRQTIQRLEGVGVLAGGIAHDFNNILTSIFGSISLAKIHLSEDDKAHAFVKQAEDSISRATQLTQKLLTFSKGGEPVKEQVSLGRLVYETMSFDLSGSNVKLVFQEEDDLWCAKVDKGQIQQVFSNLAINADQAMAAGGHLYISLQNYICADNGLTAVSELKAGSYVKAVVRDEGSGIASKDLSRIFDPYYTTKETGRGLGLAGVYSIIKKHHGGIDVASHPGEGATFTLYLPALKEVEQTVKMDTMGKTAVTLERAARVLVMDDDAIICSVLKDMLGMMRCEVSTCENGEEATAMYEKAYQDKHPYDIVILDLTIPGGVGGQEVVRDILAYDPDARAIVSTGYAADPVVASYEEYGFQGAVVKPYTFDTLRSVISDVLTRD